MRAAIVHVAGDVRIETVRDLTGGPAPVRAYIEQLLPEVLDGRIEPGKVFDRSVDLDGIPDVYRAMDERTALKVLVQP